MRGFGQGLREFKRASTELMDEVDRAGNTSPEPPKKAAAVSTPAPQTDEGRVSPEGGAKPGATV